MCTEPLTPSTWQIIVLNVTFYICLNFFYFFQHLQHWIFPCNVPCIQYIAWTFDTFDMRNKGIKSNLFFVLISFDTFDMRYFLQICMQHAPLTPPTYPGSYKTCFLYISVFGRKSFLIFPIIDLWSDLWSNLHRLGVPKPNHFAFSVFFCLKLIFGGWHPPRNFWSEPRRSEPSILGYTGSADDYLTQFLRQVNKVRSESEPSWKKVKWGCF